MSISVRDELYEKVEVRPCAKDRYRVLKTFTYEDITIPEGFITNGADVPRFLWSFFPPNRPAYLPAVIIHDFLCDKGEFKKADDFMFYYEN